MRRDRIGRVKSRRRLREAIQEFLVRGQASRPAGLAQGSIDAERIATRHRVAHAFVITQDLKLRNTLQASPDSDSSLPLKGQCLHPGVWLRSVLADSSFFRRERLGKRGAL